MYVLRFGGIVKRNALKPSDYYLTRKKESTRHHSRSLEVFGLVYKSTYPKVT